MARSRRRCIFCGSTDRQLSQEHVLSNWISEELAKRWPGLEFEHRSSEYGWAKPFTARRMELAPRVVCRSRVGRDDGCNDGWMRRLEEEVKPIFLPMLDGRPVTLGYTSQRLVATWSMMKFMVDHYTSHPGTPEFFTQAEREEFMRTFTIPEGTAIFLGQTPDRTVAGWSMGRFLTEWPGGGYIGILAFGPVVIIFLTSRAGHALNFTDNLNEFLAHIYPRAGAKRWPRLGHFDELGILSFLRRPPVFPAPLA